MWPEKTAAPEMPEQPLFRYIPHGFFLEHRFGTGLFPTPLSVLS